MVIKEIKLSNEDGLHARAAALFVRTANKYESEISLACHEDEVNGKSIIGIMSLGAFEGEIVKIKCDGSDEEEALKNLTSLIENNFINV